MNSKTLCPLAQWMQSLHCPPATRWRLPLAFCWGLCAFFFSAEGKGTQSDVYLPDRQTAEMRKLYTEDWHPLSFPTTLSDSTDLPAIPDTLRPVDPDSVPVASSLPASEQAVKPTDLSTPSVMELANKPGKKTFFWQAPYPNSTMALVWALLPGGGQIYNKRYWKAPLAWSAMAGAFSVIAVNQRSYKEYHTAWADLKGPDPMSKSSWKSFVPFGADPEQYLKDGSLDALLSKGTKQHKANRDLSIAVGIAVYLLTILDAYVDAELYYFDAGSDLSVQVGPVVAPPSAAFPMSAGIGCSIAF